MPSSTAICSPSRSTHTPQGPPCSLSADFNFRAIHAQDRMIPLGDGFGFTDDVMPDQGAAEAIGAAVGIAAVHQLSVEEEHIARLHDQRHRLVSSGQLDRVTGETYRGIRIDAAQDGYVVRARHNTQAAVFFIAAVNRHPGGDAGARVDAQIELILMQGLDRARRAA